MRNLAIVLLFLVAGCAGDRSGALPSAELVTDSGGKPIHIAGKQGVTISRQSIAGHPEGIFIEDCQRVRIENCTVSSCGTLIRLLNCRDVSITGCALRNPTGPPDPDGQAIQLDKCKSVVIAGNVMSADPGKSYVEDWISIYDSQHVVVKNNRICGGATSTSGTGVCVDHLASADVLIEGNTLVHCGAVGINVAGGSSITVRRNRILDTFIADPNAGNVGIAIMRAYTTRPTDVSITGNVIAVTVPGKGESPIWDGTGKAVISGNTTGKAARKLLSALGP